MADRHTPAGVDQIREVFAYIERFKGSLFVIKIDYAILVHSLFASLVADIASLHRMGIRIAIVAGARGRIDELLAANAVESRRVGHVRISAPAEMPFIKMAAFDAATKIMTQLSAASCSALIGNWVRARSLGVVEGVDYLNTGRVERVRDDLIDHVLSEDFIPVFPCIGWSATGEPYNLSSDELAGLLGRRLRADKVFFIESAAVDWSGYEVPKGIEREESGRISGLRLDQAEELLEANRARREALWYDLLSQAVHTCRGGVRRVHIVDGRAEGVLLREVFTNLGSGTMIYTNEYESIRAMRSDDIPEVLRVMQPFVQSGALVPRDRESLERGIDDYVVYEIDGIIHGCGALCEYGEGTAEIAGIAVDEEFAHLGIGRRVVSYLIDLARRRGLTRLFLLTTRTWDWFVQLGFRQAKVSDLPARRRATYDSRRNSRVMVYDVAGK